MAKFLLFALVFLVYWYGFGPGSRTRRPPAAGGGPDKTQQMVRCARCGLFLPRVEGLPRGDDFYCCEDHRAQGAAAGVAGKP